MRDLRRRALAAALLLAGCSDNGGQAPVDEGEPPVAGCSESTTAGGALTRVCFPADWNGNLVVYAHGYVDPGASLATPEDSVDGTPVEELITGLGYGYATTSYRANGLIADVAVSDVEALVELVRRTVRPDPSLVYLVGVSEGGLVAALAAEQDTDRYTGAVAACGPIGDFARQIDYFNDVRVVFDYFFPGLLPGSAIDPPEALRSEWDETYVPAVLDALASDPGAANELAEVTGLPVDPANPAVLGAAVVDVLWYNVFGTADAHDRLGGQPYENQERVYTGSSDDAALNDGVARFSADPDARAALARFETSGEPSAPIAILHTSQDPIVPFFHQELYAEKVAAAGRGDLLARFDVDRSGHCAFTATELLAAFAALPH